MTKHSRAALRVALICVVVAGVRSGDYGLTVDNTVKGCERKRFESRNVCNAATVIEDLNRRFVMGDDHRLEALHVGLFHCSVSFAGSEEKNAVYGEFVRILAQPMVHFEKSLMHDVGCFPFKSMKLALEHEMAKSGHADAAVRRLDAAHAMIVERYRD